MLHLGDKSRGLGLDRLVRVQCVEFSALFLADNSSSQGKVGAGKLRKGTDSITCDPTAGRHGARN